VSALQPYGTRTLPHVLWSGELLSTRPRKIACTQCPRLQPARSPDHGCPRPEPRGARLFFQKSMAGLVVMHLVQSLWVTLELDAAPACLPARGRIDPLGSTVVRCSA
jgi:hypothetical protein